MGTEDWKYVPELNREDSEPPAQVIAHMNLYWQYESARGRAAGMATTEEVTLTG